MLSRVFPLTTSCAAPEKPPAFGRSGTRGASAACSREAVAGKILEKVALTQSQISGHDRKFVVSFKTRPPEATIRSRTRS
jgi:hypothetical protein